MINYLLVQLHMYSLIKPFVYTPWLTPLVNLLSTVRLFYDSLCSIIVQLVLIDSSFLIGRWNYIVVKFWWSNWIKNSVALYNNELKQLSKSISLNRLLTNRIVNKTPKTLDLEKLILAQFMFMCLSTDLLIYQLFIISVCLSNQFFLAYEIISGSIILH